MNDEKAVEGENCEVVRSRARFTMKLIKLWQCAEKVIDFGITWKSKIF